MSSQRLARDETVHGTLTRILIGLRQAEHSDFHGKWWLQHAGTLHIPFVNIVPDPAKGKSVRQITEHQLLRLEIGRGLTD